MLSDITVDGVEAAIAEFDQIGRQRFLDHYGFHRSTDYVLVSNGREYDSKAICGAAHGWDFPAQGPLRASDFSGGRATVQRKLESLGYEVRSPASSSKQWTDEERALALHLYLQHGTLNRTSPLVIELSQELNERAFHPDAGSRDNFRNPSGVALKLANFAAIDPSHAGAGMVRYSRGDVLTWERYAGDEDELARAVDSIRSGGTLPHELAPVHGAPLRREIERNISPSFEVAPTAREPFEALRREAGIVEQFAVWLRNRGSSVCSHHYDVTTPPLRNDLFDETDGVLWEAKGEVGRFAIRLAVGQLLDYKRFEPGPISLGILVPRRPSDDLLAFIATVPAKAAWPDGSGGFVVHEG